MLPAIPRKLGGLLAPRSVGEAVLDPELHQRQCLRPTGGAVEHVLQAFRVRRTTAADRGAERAHSSNGFPGNGRFFAPSR